MSRSASLRAILVAITVAGVSLPHMVAGEVAGSLPSLLVGLAVGLGCLALGGRTRGGRLLGGLAIAFVAIAPLVGWFAQEAAERGSGFEAHAEPSLLASIATQGPLIVLAVIAARLLVAAVAIVVRVLTRRTTQTGAVRASSVRTPVLAELLPIRLARLSSNGQRAPPFAPAPHQPAPLG